eukprot:Clim_evm13s223 gene=Clim_evmTU13s223
MAPNATTTPETTQQQVYVTSRLYNDIPAVKYYIDFVGGMYTGVKSNKYVGSYVSDVEKSVIATADSAATAYEPFLTKANEFSVKQLDFVEEKLPVIKRDPMDAVNYVQDTFKTTTTKARALPTEITTEVRQRVNQGIDAADSVVDKYLPGDEKEQTDADRKESEQLNELAKAKMVGYKAGSRVYRRAIASLDGLKQRSDEQIKQIEQISLVQYAKETANSTYSSVSQTYRDTEKFAAETVEKVTTYVKTTTTETVARVQKRTSEVVSVAVTTATGLGEKAFAMLPPNVQTIAKDQYTFATTKTKENYDIVVKFTTETRTKVTERTTAITEQVSGLIQAHLARAQQVFDSVYAQGMQLLGYSTEKAKAE